jgi:uncharacterized protein YlxP (DUF503 family)
MFVAICRIDLHIPASRSLKVKRSAVRRIKERLIQRYRASVAEVDHQDLWQRATLGLALVSGSPEDLRRLLQQMRGLVEREPDVVILSWVEDIDRYDPDRIDLRVEGDEG